MKVFEIITENNHIIIDEESIFPRQEYTLYGDGSMYTVYNGNSNIINYEIYKNYFDNYLIERFIIVNNDTNRKFAVYITDKALDNEYITVNNKLSYIRPYIYQSGICSYDEGEYFYFITDIIEEYTKYESNNLVTLFYLIPCFEEFNNINYVCPDIKRYNIVTGKFSNADDSSLFIFMNEFVNENTITTNKNILNSIYTEIYKNVTINDNLITTMLIQMSNIGLYNCTCKNVKFFDQYSIFDIDNKYYFRDEAAKKFAPNKGFKTPYDFLSYHYVDKYKILNQTFEYPFNNSKITKIIFKNLDYFDYYYTFDLRAKRLGLDISRKVYDYLINHMYMFEETYEDFQETNKPKFIAQAITEDIFDTIRENELMDYYYNFTETAPQFLKNIINQYDYDYIMKIFTKYDYKVVDFIINRTRNIYGYDSETQDKISDYSYLSCIGFKNIFIKTIFCILNNISNGEFINSEYIIENFDTLITDFNNYIGKFGDLYFSTLAIGIIYLTYTRIENINPDFTFMHDILDKLASYVTDGIVLNTKIADEMIKNWCIKGSMIPLVKCDQSILSKQLYSDKSRTVDNTYKWINFDDYVNPVETGRRRYRFDN